MSDEELVVELPEGWAGKRADYGYVVWPLPKCHVRAWISVFGDLCVVGATSAVNVIPQQVWLHLISAHCGRVPERND
jgi:hypothetical protein